MKKQLRKKLGEIRVGQTVWDGKREGSIIAVSGDDVAIRWCCGVIDQRKREEMSKLEGALATPPGAS